MKIAILSHALYHGGGASVGYNLINSLLGFDNDNQYIISVPDTDYYRGLMECNSDNVTFEWLACPDRKYDRILFELFRLPYLVNKFNADAIICLGNFAMINFTRPQYVLLHNPYYLYPKTHYGKTFDSRLLIVVQKTFFYMTARLARGVFCQTNAMKDRLIEKYPFANKVSVLPNAVSSKIIDINNVDDNFFPNRVVDGRKALFCLTGYYSHKNLEKIVELFYIKKAELSDYCVIITVPDEAKNSAAISFLSKIDNLGLSDVIINVGYLKQEHLPSYYANSYALFLPTLLESYTATYVESMYFGLPILTSDFDFAHDVCKEAALYFDPFSVDSMLKCILSLNGREMMLSDHGKDRYFQFDSSWADISYKMLKYVLENE